MFKLKISIYMKSGNVIYFWANKFKYTKLSNPERMIEWVGTNFNSMTIDVCEIEAIIVKKWYQAWG